MQGFQGRGMDAGGSAKWGEQGLGMIALDLRFLSYWRGIPNL